MKNVVVVGAFDSKGEEYQYLIGKLQQAGVGVISVDLGTRSEPPFAPTVSAAEVSDAGGCPLEVLRREKDRSECLEIMSGGAGNLIAELVESGAASGVISMGGGQGTYMAVKIMSRLPVGFPKLIVSTIVNLDGTTGLFAQANDVMLMNSVVDVSGLNSIMRLEMDKAAYAMAGMVNSGWDREMGKDGGALRIGLTMWGVTTPCVSRVYKQLVERGYDVYVFHANGMGGRVFESLIRQGFLQGVADITLSELSNPLAGGDYAVIPDRLTGAGAMGIPQVVCPGGMDMVQAPHPFDNLPETLRDRARYYHNDDIMFLRSNEADNECFGREMMARLRAAQAPVQVLLPMRGLSASDIEGGPLYDPQADATLFRSICQNAAGIPVTQIDAHINDDIFADAVAEAMDRLMKVCPGKK